MKRHTGLRMIFAGVLVITIAAIVTIRLSARPGTASTHLIEAAGNRLVVHEWGTFTSIAGKNGVALEWRPLNGASDLPKFVNSIQSNGSRHIPGKFPSSVPFPPFVG